EKAHEPEENHKPEVSHQSEVNHQPEEVALTEQQRQLAGVQTSVIEPRIYNQRVYAPGEVKVNGYSSSLVSPRTDSVVISRHAALGDEVEKGQVLVTLFSETIAQSQAEFLIASSNYSRAKKLDKNTISESALVEAENRYKASYGELIEFGLTPNA
ncbi:MAG TPA: efflux transporter periplasmic adaptor subunit, partial [Alteromonas macleodii]|nr:efflux transporter periplasmic adaptor subunit [Alteromonas macleodii]